MDKIKRFLDIYVPVTTCTLRCHYCYITQHRLFEGALLTFKYSPSHVRKALSKERLGGTCLINLCGGGETLLAPQIVEYVRELLEEGHYVMIVTNATISKRFDEIALFPKELLSHLFFKFSYHYMELKKRNLIETFFRNVCKMRDAGASFTLESTPSDELIPYIGEMQKEALDHVGAVNHITVARDERVAGELPILTNMNRDQYKKLGLYLSLSSLTIKCLFSVLSVKNSVMLVHGHFILIWLLELQLSVIVHILVKMSLKILTNRLSLSQ